MEDLANEFSYAMIEDIQGSAPCGLGVSSSKKHSSDDQQSNSKKNNFTYKSKLSYSVNLNLNNSSSLMSSPISKNINPKSTKHRYSTRSSSMLLKSNSLALSDSESTFSDDSKEKETSFFNKKPKKPKKPRRKKTEKEPQIYPCIPISTNYNNKDQYYGKRKRSTTISQSSYEQNSQMSTYTTNKLKKNEFSNLTMQYDFDDKSKLTKYQTNDKMEIEDQEDSSSLSDESNSLSDPRFADDEQSDFELTRTLRAQNRKYGRTSLEKNSFGIVNPFSMLSSSPSTSSNFLWKVKKRRKNMNLPLNLPNNHFN